MHAYFESVLFSFCLKIIRESLSQDDVFYRNRTKKSPLARQTNTKKHFNLKIEIK